MGALLTALPNCLSPTDVTMRTSGTRYTRTSSASPTPSTQLPAQTMVNMLPLQFWYLFGLHGVRIIHLFLFWLEFKEKKLKSSKQLLGMFLSEAVYSE